MLYRLSDNFLVAGDSHCTLWSDELRRQQAGREEGSKKIFPNDLLPHILTRDEWHASSAAWSSGSLP